MQIASPAQSKPDSSRSVGSRAAPVDSRSPDRHGRARMTNPASPPLVRALGRWTMVALVVNGVIGSAIFGLPDDVVRLVGDAAPFAYLIAAAGMLIFMAVFAELSSQFNEAGGPYLYAREAFGRFWGIEMGWFTWLVRLTAAAANANLFVIYLGEFWPGATAPVPRALLLAALLGTLTLINLRGVSGAAKLSNLFTAAKLLPLALLIALGLFLAPEIAPDAATSAAVTAPGVAGWTSAFIVLLFTFGGFDMALIPAGECKDTRRDLPFALFTGLVVITTVYVLLQVMAMRTVPDLANSQRPLADAARSLVGPIGAGLIAIGAMVSTSGYLSAQLIGVPRLTFALAQRGDFPAAFGAVHERFRTPHVSILVWGVLTFLLALLGNFIWNVSLSGAARLLTYGLACAALIRLRRLRPDAPAFRLPAGVLVAAAGLAICLVMVRFIDFSYAWVIALVAFVAAANWWTVRARPPRDDGGRGFPPRH
ncbi:MAG: amino acid transporter [Opitutus sp.]|nr:amino acid transporter [Opitutus sp.]